MSKLDRNSLSPEFFKGLKAADGAINLKVDGVEVRYPVKRAEVKEEFIALEFDMSGGNPDRNEFIYLAIDKGVLKQRVDLPNAAVYLLYQNRTQEWVAEKGWIRVEWEQGSNKVQGLMDEIGSDREGNSVLTAGKFEVTLG